MTSGVLLCPNMSRRREKLSRPNKTIVTFLVEDLLKGRSNMTIVKAAKFT